MSFFTKLFGGGESKPEPKPAEKKQESDLEKKFEREKVRNNIQKQLKQFDDKQKKLEVKVNSLKQKAKQYISQGKQKQGRKYLAEAARLNKQIQQVIVHKKAVLENVNQLQVADMTAETTKLLQETKKHLQEHQKNSDKLMNLIEEANFRKKEQQQMHQQMKQLVQNDDDKQAQDQMLNEIMAQINRQKAKEKKQIAGKQIGVKVPQQKNKPVQQKDEIEDMLQGL